MEDGADKKAYKRENERFIKMISAKKYLKKIVRFKPAERVCDLALDMNEGVGLPEYFIREVRQKINSKLLSRYPEYNKLNCQIAAHNHLNPENICISNGSDAAIKYIFDAYVSRGDKVLFVEPTFAMYSVYCSIFNAETISMKYNKDLSFPLEQFQSRLSRNIKVAVIVNPNNPTGSVIELEALLATIKIAHKKNVLLIVDEAYFYFYPETAISLINNFDNLIVLRTFSKLCSLAVLRIGYAAASQGIIENLEKVKPTFDVNGVAALFAENLMNNSGIIDNLINATLEGKQYLAKNLDEAGIEYRCGHANFILIRCKIRPEEIKERLLARGILVHAGFSHPALQNCIRVTVGDKVIMKKFWNNFIKVWDGRKKGSKG